MKVLIGLLISIGATAVYANETFTRVEVPTNGRLVGYVVQDADGNEVCRDPDVWNQFRGGASYIVCR